MQCALYRAKFDDSQIHEIFVPWRCKLNNKKNDVGAEEGIEDEAEEVHAEVRLAE
jgi:hypothetical protein